MNSQLPGCADCPYSSAKRACKQREGTGPDGCPTLNHKKLAQEAYAELSDPELLEFAKQCSVQEAHGYTNARPIKPRIQEVMEFANRMHFKRLGLVFCIGLRKEANIINEIFIKNNFSVVSVVCKVGQITKDKIEIGQEHQVDMTAREESMCNPIFQAYLVNYYETQLNILVGLCVGHDSLFLKYSQAYCTILAVKDRLLGHNPLAAIYQYGSYYRHLKHAISNTEK